MAYINAKQGLYWNKDKYERMIMIDNYVIDALFGTVILREEIENEAPEGTYGIILFDEWVDIGDAIAGHGDYFDLIFNEYGDKVKELAEKFDFFSNF